MNDRLVYQGESRFGKAIGSFGVRACVYMWGGECGVAEDGVRKGGSDRQ